MFAAAYKVIWGETLVLLDLDDLMETEPTLAESRLTQTITPLRAANPIDLPRGNVSHSLTFSRVKEFETADLARAFAFSHAVALAALTKADLTIQISDTVSETLFSAVLLPGGYQAVVKGQFFHATYHLKGHL